MRQNTTPPSKSDITAGFLVFLIALPLCLGIAGASGVPPVAGILTAIVGGLLTKFMGGSRLTIKGPAAGLIVIVLGAVTDLGGNDLVAGYHRMLAVGVVAGVIQIVLALVRFGALAEAMPASVVRGMLAAIGVIIMSKQAHVLLGVKPEGKEPVHLIQELPHSFAHLNPYVTLVGVVALVIMFGMPFIKAMWAKSIPSQLVVLAVTVPLAMLLGFNDKHDYLFSSASYNLDPAKFLVKLPLNILSAITFPDFSQILSATSLKYIIMFSIVGSIESLLTVSAVDEVIPIADIVILAVPDIYIGKVATEMLPKFKSGAMVVTLDPAAAVGGHLPKRDDISYFVTHPTHPSVFNWEEDKKRHFDYFGGITARQAIVCECRR